MNGIQVRQCYSFDVKVAQKPEEILELRKSGWQKYDEMTINGTEMHFYSKPKRFEGLQ